MIRAISWRWLQIAEDSKFIRGDGSSDTPKGILSSVASGQKFNGNSTFNLANAVSDLLKAMYRWSRQHPMQRLDGCSIRAPSTR